MAYLYHFSASQQITPEAVQHVDGYMECKLIISTLDMFKEARAEIARMAGIEPPEKMVLHSLTLLNPH